ncbi:MAG: lysophospholipid acyltransferase family protein [bacterium]
MNTKLMQEKDLEKVSPIFKGKLGNQLAKFVLHFLSIDKINSIYGRSSDFKGSAFTERFLKGVGVEYLIGNAEHLMQLPEGAFVTVSNHPYGGLDGIMLIDMIAGIRPDYKFMVNQFLSLVKTMDDNFIKVTPKTDISDSQSKTSLAGIRETLKRLQSGHPVGFFPAGAVSNFYLKHFHIRDREWQKSILKLIQSAKVPVLPIRFFDHNSAFFYFLGLIDWRIRSLRLPSEILNKKGKQLHIGIGEMISVEEQSKFTDYQTYGDFLRNALYDLPKPSSYTSMSEVVNNLKSNSNT